jgi:hypothetical protein
VGPGRKPTKSDCAQFYEVKPPPSPEMSGENPRTITIHEAGHAVVAHRLGIPVDGMVINGRFGQTGLQPPPAGAGRARLERAATAALAGSVASAIHQGVSCKFTPNKEMLSDETRAEDLAGLICGGTTLETNALLQALADSAIELLNDRENWALVERLADELLTKGCLTAPEVATIVPLSARAGIEQPRS